MLINLISNAVKFSPEGSVIQIRHHLTAQGCIEFSVTDKGPGMSADVIKAVMQPFVQADTGLSRRHEGTGLGLPLVKAFIDAHGGTFELISKVGVGTTACIKFPAERSIEQVMAQYAVI